MAGLVSAVPVALALIWNQLKPLLFPPPTNMESWASHAVPGERVWMARKEVLVPDHHRLAPTILAQWRRPVPCS